MMRPSSDSTPRNANDRWAFATGLAHQQKKSRRTVARAAFDTIEALEGRRLLATVGGNQIALYQGPDGPVKIEINGRGTFDFVGATLGNGAGQLNDIPMTIFDTGGRVIRQNLGGFAGLDGIAPISEVIDPNPSNSSGGADAIAADNRGRTYGVVLGGNSVAITRYDFNDGGTPNIEVTTLAAKMIALVQSEITPAAQLADITRIIGADFNPSTSDTVNQNLLYFAANYNIALPNGQNSTERVNIPVMFTYDVSTKDVDIVRGEFGFQNEDSDIHVADFTFVNNNQIAWFGTVDQGNGGGGGGDDDAGLYITDADFIVDDNFRLLRVGPNDPDPPEPEADIASMEFIPGSNYLYIVRDDSADDDGTTATDSDDDATLARFTLTGTNVNRGIEIGNVDDPDNDPADGAGLGDNLDDLAWNPRLEQQFFEPGKRGAMLGLDFGTIAGIDVRERFAETELFAVYGKNVSANTSVAISTSVLDPDIRLTLNQRLFRGLMTPFGAGPGVIESNMIIPPIGLGAGTGGLYLGLRTANVANALTIPVIGLSSSTLRGGSLGFALPNTVRPGIFVNGSIRDLYFAGTITGSVRLSGSIDTFYAGNILTGDILNGTENRNDNFYVDGDLRNLVVSGGIGAPDEGTGGGFNPLTDLRVNGRIQQLKTGNTFRGALDVNGATSERSIVTTLEELENVAPSNLQNAAARLFEGRNLTPALLGNVSSTASRGLINGVVNNDTFETAEILGSYRSRARDKGQQIDLVGEIDNTTLVGDQTDFYGVPLLAGQSMVVQLQSLTTLQATVRVIDPNGQVFATDLSNQNPLAFLNQPFAVKADKPGLWRVQILPYTGGLASRPYELTIDKLGEVAIGGLVSQGNVLFNNETMALRARNGDVGAVLAAGVLEGALGTGELGTTSAFFNPVQADRGNIRSLEGSSISRQVPGGYTNFPTFLAPRGSIGLVRANAADGFVYFNVFGVNSVTGSPAPQLTIGGDYQVIESPNDFAAVLSANGGIGVIRVGSVQTDLDLQSFIEINADNSGKAELGLFDVVGDLGQFSVGGPALNVGNGGNIRYLRVGGTAYSDTQFGRGTPIVLTGSDETVTLRDDSGTNVRITPIETSIQTSTGTGGTTTGGGTDPFGGGFITDPFNGSVTGGFSNPFPTGTVPEDDVVGDVSVSSYPVRSGGVVIYNVLSTTGVNISTFGNRAGGGGQVADITTLRTGATGAAVVDTGTASEVTTAPSDRTPLSLASGSTLDVILSGSGTVNVFEIGADSGADLAQGIAGGITNTANYTRIINNTSGEIVNVAAASIGRLEASRLGFAAPVANVRVEGLNPVGGDFADVYPVDTSRNLIRVGDAIDIISRGAIGNIAATGDIQNVVANNGNSNDRNQWEGVVGPIYATGTIRRLEIGEGLQSSGNGDIAFGGIFAGNLGLVTNANGNGDVRGDILVGRYLEGITLGGGGSILDSDIIVADPDIGFDNGDDVITGFRFGQEQFNVQIGIISQPTNPNTLQGIGDVLLSGNGGIMGSRFSGAGMGQVTVGSDGFGVFTSSFTSSSGASMEGLSAGGLGIRGTDFGSGSFVGDIVATGGGKVRSIKDFARSVRQSENKDGIDEKTGLVANASTDLYLYLGATEKLNKISGVTDEGVIEDSILSASRSLDSVTAYDIRSRYTNGSRPRDQAYPMQINFADSIGSITAKRDINGARIVGGDVGSLTSGRDMLQLQLQATGRVTKINSGRNVLGSARFNVINEGSIGTFQTNGNMNGVLFASTGIDALIIKGDVASEAPGGGIHSDGSISLIKIGGSTVRKGSISSGGKVAQLVIDGDVGEDSVIRAKTFGKIKISGTEFGKIVRG